MTFQKEVTSPPAHLQVGKLDPKSRLNGRQSWACNLVPDPERARHGAGWGMVGVGAPQHLSSLCQAQRPAGPPLPTPFDVSSWEAGQFGGGEDYGGVEGGG